MGGLLVGGEASLCFIYETIPSLEQEAAFCDLYVALLFSSSSVFLGFQRPLTYRDEVDVDVAALLFLL